MLETVLTVIICILGAASIPVAWRLGAFRPRPLELIRHLFPAEPAGLLVANAGVGIGVYFAMSMVMVVATGLNPESLKDPTKVGKVLALTIVVATGLLIALLVGLKWMVPRGLDRLGVIGKPPRDVLYAVGLLYGSLPLVLLASVLAEEFYKLIQYEHPQEHDLLRVMKDPDLRWWAGLAVVALAPLYEELFFRGHLQTILRRWLSGMPKPAVLPPPLPVGSPYGVPVATGAYAVPEPMPAVIEAPPIPLPSPRRAFHASLWSVVITSLAFAAVHDAWSWPPIFALSLVLGYAYERTGNLWVTIVMHALFNGTMTAFYLFSR